MFKPCASLLSTCLIMLTLMVGLHCFVQLMSYFDCAANGKPMAYYRKSYRSPTLNWVFDREQRPAPPDYVVKELKH